MIDEQTTREPEQNADTSAQLQALVGQRVVCAACKYKLYMLIGPRHWDGTMRRQYTAMVVHYAVFSGNDDHKFEQGFIDEFGGWLTREQAWKVAEKAEQIIHRVGGDEKNGGTLYSENLY